MAKFVTEAGRTIVLNPAWVVAVEPAIGKGGAPVVGLTAILLGLVPPNVPGGQHISIIVRGTADAAAQALGFNHESVTEF